MTKKKHAMDVQQSIWNGIYTRVFLANSMLFLGMQMVNTLIAKYADALGAKASIVGLVASLFALTALLFKIVSGPAIDAFNRKYILMGAIFVISLAFFGFGISDHINMLFAFRLLQGCGQAFTATTCLALAADSLPKEKFGVGIGTYTLAQAICMAIGPMIGLGLAEKIGYQGTFIVAGIFTLTAVFIASTMKIEFKRVKTFKIIPANIFAKEAVLPAILLFFLQMTFGNIHAFLVIFATEKGVDNIGLFFTAYALSMLIAPRLVGKVSDKFGTTKAILPPMLLFAFAFVLISYANNIWMFLIAAVISAFGYGASQPAIQTLCMKCVSNERRGAASSTSYIGQDLGNLFGPVIAGVLVQSMGYSSMWRIMTIPVFISIGIVIFNHVYVKKIEDDFNLREAQIN